MASPELIQALKGHEGAVRNVRGRHVVYDDATGKPLSDLIPLQGNPTLGFGRNIAVRQLSEEDKARILADVFGPIAVANPEFALVDILTGIGISDDLAHQFLADDVDETVRLLEVEVPEFKTLDPVRQSALVNMAFNVGARGVAQFPKMRAALAKGDFDEAAKEMLDSKFAQQTGQRAADLAEILRTGVLPGGSDQSAVPQASTSQEANTEENEGVEEFDSLDQLSPLDESVRPSIVGELQGELQQVDQLADQAVESLTQLKEGPK